MAARTTTVRKTAPRKAVPPAAPAEIAIDDLGDIVEQLRRVKARKAKVEAEEGKLIKQIKERMGDAVSATVGGTPVVRWATTERRTVSVDMIKDKFPEVADACVKVIQVRTFQLVKPE